MFLIVPSKWQQQQNQGCMLKWATYRWFDYDNIYLFNDGHNTLLLKVISAS